MPGTPSNDLNISQSGYVVFDGTATFSGRTFQAGTGISLTNPDGTTGNTTISVNGGVVGETITGNTGGALSPTAGNWNIVGNNSTTNGFATFNTGSGSTLTVKSFGVAKWIVNPVASIGTHQTIQSAINSAVSGETIFITPGTYTENLTLKAGVNICAFDCDSQTPNVTIVGNCTFSAAGTVTISGIRLQTNSAAFLTVSGSAASIISLKNCYLNCSNNTGISFTSSSGSAEISIISCQGDLGTTGIGLFSHSSAGNLIFSRSQFFNNGGSSTASTISSGSSTASFSIFPSPITTSGTAVLTASSCNFNSAAQNVTALTLGGSGGHTISNCAISSGTASGISIGGSLTLSSSVITSSNTNAITGAGTLVYSGLSFAGTSSTINTTTQTAREFRPGITRSGQQPAFLAYLSTDVTDVTGAGSAFTLGTGTALTEVFDQNGDFNTNGTFTAPVTGKYLLCCSLQVKGITSAMTSETLTIVTSNRSYTVAILNPNSGPSTTVGSLLSGSMLADMDAADTATIVVTVSNGAGNTADIGGTSGTERSFFSGNLVC